MFGETAETMPGTHFLPDGADSRMELLKKVIFLFIRVEIMDMSASMNPIMLRTISDIMVLMLQGKQCIIETPEVGTGDAFARILRQTFLWVQLWAEA